MTDKKTKSNPILLIFIFVCTASFIFAGVYGISKSFEESAEAAKQADIENEQKYERRLAAVADELGIETKYVLYDGRDLWDGVQHFYKTNRKEYIVVFDEKDQIKTIIEEKEED